jgi:hypothetical protein
MAYDKAGNPRSGMARSKFADEVMGKKSTPKPAAKPDMEAEQGEQSIHDVVAEHGPAHEVSMHHDHESKHSHVVSHHGEHEHEAHFHGDDYVAQASDHAKEASGGEGNDGEDRRDKEEMAEEKVSPGIHSDISSMLA